MYRCAFVTIGIGNKQTWDFVSFGACTKFCIYSDSFFSIDWSLLLHTNVHFQQWIYIIKYFVFFSSCFRMDVCVCVFVYALCTVHGNRFMVPLWWTNFMWNAAQHCLHRKNEKKNRKELLMIFCAERIL